MRIISPLWRKEDHAVRLLPEEALEDVVTFRDAGAGAGGRGVRTIYRKEEEEGAQRGGGGRISCNNRNNRQSPK